MPKCTTCGDHAGEGFDLCYDCGQAMREYQAELVEVEFKKVAGETDKAWRVLLDDSDPFEPWATWIPKSISEMDEGSSVVLVPRWFADREALV